MTIRQVAYAALQQMQGDGLTVDSVNPLKVSGDDHIIERWGTIMPYIRKRVTASHESQPNFDEILAEIAEVKLPPQETDLVRRVGQPSRFVWVNASPFFFGRLEAVLPGVALVTVHPSPVLPEEPLARWEARTANAIPFSIGLVELDHIDQVVSDGVGEVLGVPRRPAEKTSRPRRDGAERSAS